MTNLLKDNVRGKAESRARNRQVERALPTTKEKHFADGAVLVSLTSTGLPRVAALPDNHFREEVRKRLLADLNRWPQWMPRQRAQLTPTCDRCKREFPTGTEVRLHKKECMSFKIEIPAEVRLQMLFEHIMETPLPKRRRRVSNETARVIKTEAFRLLIKTEPFRLLTKGENESMRQISNRCLFFYEETKAKRYDAYRKVVEHHRARVTEFLGILKNNIHQ